MVSVPKLISDSVLACTMLEAHLPEHLMFANVVIKTQ